MPVYYQPDYPRARHVAPEEGGLRNGREMLAVADLMKCSTMLLILMRELKVAIYRSDIFVKKLALL